METNLENMLHCSAVFQLYHLEAKQGLLDQEDVLHEAG